MREKLLKQKNALRLKRKKRVRGKIAGTVENPRASVFKSNKYLYAQAIDDVKGETLCAADGAKLGFKANKEGAQSLAKAFAKALKSKKIDTVLLDKNGYKYHGVVASFADALRDSGIKL